MDSFFFQSIFRKKRKTLKSLKRKWVTTCWIIIGKYLDNDIVTDNIIYFFFYVEHFKKW